MRRPVIPRRAALLIGGVASALTMGVGMLAITGATVPTLEDRVCALEVNAGIGPCSTTTTAPSTTTTEATTTTEPPTTTTTEPPTTTTETPPTTTTTIPEVLDPGPGGKAFAYSFFVRADGIEWWEAPYRFNLPYGPYGWGAGDRLGYRCDWGHLLPTTGLNLVTYPANNDQRDWVGGIPIGRYAVVRTILNEADGAYVIVNDRHMIEGRRAFDGTFVGDNGVQTESVRFCSDILTTTYDPYTGPDERPLIVFRAPNGDVAEIRDYPGLIPDESVRFHLIDGDGSDGVVAVTAHGADDRPGVVVYYWGLNGGTVEAVLP